MIIQNLSRDDRMLLFGMILWGFWSRFFEFIYHFFNVMSFLALLDEVSKTWLTVDYC